MAGAEWEPEKPPRIALTQISAKATEGEARWSMGWAVENRGDESLAIHSVRLPHGQFKSDELRFDPARVLPPGEKVSFTIPVRCHEPPGWVTENAFVIFYATWLGQRWRIFARVRVTVAGDGSPETAIESITAQKAGFSGIDL